MYQHLDLVQRHPCRARASSQYIWGLRTLSKNWLGCATHLEKLENKIYL